LPTVGELAISTVGCEEHLLSTAAVEGRLALATGGPTSDGGTDSAAFNLTATLSKAFPIKLMFFSSF